MQPRDKYWLYVVYDCGTPNPRLLRGPLRSAYGKDLASVVSSSMKVRSCKRLKDEGCALYLSLMSGEVARAFSPRA